MHKLAIVGGGKMGEALVTGLIQSGWASPDEIVVSEIHEERREHLAKEHGIHVTGDTAEAVGSAGAVLLAVKPQDIDEVLRAMSGVVRPGQLVMSIAAGIPIEVIERHLAGGVPVVRAMPNTPALLREGAAAIAAGSHASADDMATTSASRTES